MTATMNDPATLSWDARIAGKRFAGMLKAAADCAAKERMRFALAAVRVEPRDGGGFEIIATDGRILVNVTMEPSDSLPALPAAVLVSTDALKRVRASDCIVPEGDTLVHYSGKGERIGALASQEGTFPNWRDIVPKRDGIVNTTAARRETVAGCGFGFDAARMMQVMKCAADALGTAQPCLVPSWTPEEKTSGPARWDGRTHDAAFVGVIMPIAID